MHRKFITRARGVVRVRTVCLFTKYCYFIGNLHWKLKAIINGVRVLCLCEDDRGTKVRRKENRKKERMNEWKRKGCVCVCE